MVNSYKYANVWTMKLSNNYKSLCNIYSTIQLETGVSMQVDVFRKPSMIWHGVLHIKIIIIFYKNY